MSRLSAEDWAAVALDALVAGGVAAVAVEPLAVRLGATKGSFYWHFANRDALLRAALELWEARYNESIEAADEQPDPVRRLAFLFAAALDGVGAASGAGVGAGAGADERGGEMNLLAAADHPLVGPVVRRVAARRTDYLIDLFRQMGYTLAEARRRGLLAHQVYLGYIEMAARLPELLPNGASAQRHYVETVQAMLTGPVAVS
jgi:AcrR family transcriptional regulator